MKVRIKTLEELIKDCPVGEIDIMVLESADKIVSCDRDVFEPWMYTEIKPEEVKLYAYEIHNNGVAFFLFDTGEADRRPKYDIVFKGVE